MGEYYPKTVRGERVEALIRAASETPCHCLSDYQRVHEGTCISCWALKRKIAAIERIVAERERLELQPVETLADMRSRAERELAWRREEVAKRRAQGERYD